jgi:hypothetical protein
MASYIRTYLPFTSLAEQFLKTTVAIRLVILFLEGSLVQLLKAKRANKMLWMKLAEHRGDASP